jgi:hypothetical protein
MYYDHLALENYAILFQHTTDTRLLPCHSHGVPQNCSHCLNQDTKAGCLKRADTNQPSSRYLEFVVVVTLYWHRAFKIQSCSSSWHRLAGNTNGTKLGSDPVIK